MEDQTIIPSSTTEILIMSILPLLKLICIALMGLILAHPKIKLIPRATFGLLTKLVFAVFLPCLIFIRLGEIITFNNLFLWWFIPVNVIISTVIGCVLGVLVVKICCPPQEYFKLTIAMTALGNTGNLPLAIVESVCRSVENHLFGLDCCQAGMGCVSFAQWFALILVYTFGYYMMGPPEEGSNGEIDIEFQQATESHDLARPLLEEARESGNEQIANRTPFIARVLANSTISRVLQPAAVATLLAFIVGMVPRVKSVVYGADAPSFIADGLELLAGAMVQLVMLVFGGMLAEGPDESRLGVGTTIGIIVARLLVVPSIGVGIVYVAGRLKVLMRGDRMYELVALLQYTTPSAMLLGAMASLRDFGVREVSAVLFWQHVFGVLSLATYMFIYFKCLLSYH